MNYYYTDDPPADWDRWCADHPEPLEFGDPDPEFIAAHIVEAVINQVPDSEREALWGIDYDQHPDFGTQSWWAREVEAFGEYEAVKAAISELWQAHSELQLELIADGERYDARD